MVMWSGAAATPSQRRVPWAERPARLASMLDRRVCARASRTPRREDPEPHFAKHPRRRTTRVSDSQVSLCLGTGGVFGPSLPAYNSYDGTPSKAHSVKHPEQPQGRQVSRRMAAVGQLQIIEHPSPRFAVV
jgi:hypothetical protein